MKTVMTIFDIVGLILVLWSVRHIFYYRRQLRDKHEKIKELYYQNETQKDELYTLRADADALAAELPHLNLMFWLLWGGVILLLIWLYRKFSV